MNRRGSMVVEFVFGLCLSAFLFSLALTVERTIQTRQRIISVARLGTALQSQTALSDAAIRTYLETLLNETRRPSGGQWTLTTGRYLQSPAAHFYNLVRTKIDVSLTDRWIPLAWTDDIVTQKGED